MTTGAPIYLVSACASGEEFVAAFRRYADRNGVVFVPISDPLPPGRKGRFALTLKDGGVMVEGDAEVVSSARTPSVLYGRVGMTLKFTGPDEPSKTTLSELEKARLALKVSPPTIAPRPADVPAEPRSRPPVPSGRVDAVNALAECVAIGEGIPLPGEGGEVPPKNAGQKFVVPSVPSIPPGRPRTASGPNPTAAKPGGTMPPPFKPPPTPTTMGVAPLAKPLAPATKTPVTPTPTAMGVAPLAKPPDPTGGLRAAVTAAAARRDDPSATARTSDLAQTMRGPAPGVDLTAPASGRKQDLDVTMRGTKPAPAPVRTPPAGSHPPAAGSTPAPPPTKPPRMATPYAPMPIVQQPAPPTVQPAPPVVAAAKPAPPEVEVSEPTDLTAIPQIADDGIPDPLSDSTVPIEVPVDGSAPVMIVAEKPKDVEKPGRETRKTVMGIAVVPSGVMVLPAAPAKPTPTEEESRDTSVMVAQGPTGPVTVRANGTDDIDALSATLPPQPPLPASIVNATIEEPTPSGDWTMTPGIDGPTITPTPRAAPGEKAAAPAPADDTRKPVSPRRQTEDWMIALDPSQPDGWSEPSKVEKRPDGDLPPGPPVSVVSSEKPLDSYARVATEPAHTEGPKVQVDPTLIEPLLPMPALDDADEPPPPAAMAPVVGDDGLMPIQTSFPPTPLPLPLQPPGATPMQAVLPVASSYVMPPVGHSNLASASGSNPAFQGPPPRMVTDAGSGFFRETGDIPSYSTGPTPAIDDAARKKRLIVILASAGAVVILGIILLLALGGSKADTSTKTDIKQVDTAITPDSKVDTKIDTAIKPDTGPPPGTGTVAVTPTDAGSEAPVVVDAPVAVVEPTECKLSVSSVPTGAEVVIDKAVVGTTPAALTLPCGVEAKLVVRKARFVSQTRAVTPRTGGRSIKVVLAKTTFSVKVSSTPAGASITVGSKSMGFTPTTVKLPSFELTTLKITKDGFAADTQKVTPKSNNQTVHATLKKLPKKTR